jgi:energy-coupling factor transport system ATP-binding protein
LFGVWHDTRLIVLVAQTAAVYAAILIPFKMGIPLIPGFSELRPANAFPIVASLLFGPAAAWGSGIGNLIGDCFGTLGPASLFGFLGNFCYGYVPHLLWGRLGLLSAGREPLPRAPRQVVEFTLICIIASAACAAVIAAGVHVLGLLPFAILAPTIFVNNLLMALLLAPPLLFFLYPRVTRWGLRYEDIIGHRGHPLHSPEQRVPGKGREGGFQDLALPLAARPSPHAFLVFEHASFTYAGADRPALDNLSLAARRGEWLAVMGRTGAGKSTLCLALNGLVPQFVAGRWQGTARVNGLDTASHPIWTLAGSVGVVFQDFEAQLVSTSVQMELAVPLQHREPPLAPSAMRERVERTLTRIGLSGLDKRHPLTLSGGQRQRLVIAAALVREPALLALDEPMTDLDPEGRRALLALLSELRAAGTALLLADHDPEEAAKADRVCVLDQGRMVWEGPPRDFFAQRELGRRCGIRPLPLAECFEGVSPSETPLTVGEAWILADSLRLSLRPVPGEPAPHSARPAAPVIELQDVSFDYERGVTVLADVNLTIREGEFVAIIGRNGSGKTTLAALLNGLTLPTRGCVLVRGRDTRKVGTGQLASDVGYVFQNPDHQIFAETVADEVAFGPRNLGCSPSDCEQRVTEALGAVGLVAPGITLQDPFSLPKGDRQRVAVASVLASRPRILIFDEPSTGLDAEQNDRMMRMICGLHRAGHTIIMITHALGLVAGSAQRCIVMADGRILADGPTREIFRRIGTDEQLAGSGLELPALTRFAMRWGHTLLTVDEAKAALVR